MSKLNEFVYAIPFKNILLDMAKTEYSITLDDLQNIQKKNSYKSENDAYCFLLLDKLRKLNKFQKKDFIEYQISLANRPKEWFLDLQSLIESATFYTGIELNVWVSWLKGLDLIIEEIYEIHFKNEKQIKQSKTKDDKPKQFYSFTTDLYYKNPQKLVSLWEELKDYHFIHKDTPLSSFKKIFSGKEIENPVIWIGNQSDLSYFIKRIHNELKVVDDLKQNQWFVTCDCFKNQNGNDFDRKKLKDSKRPNKTGDRLDAITNALK